MHGGGRERVGLARSASRIQPSVAVSRSSRRISGSSARPADREGEIAGRERPAAYAALSNGPFQVGSPSG